MLLIEDHPGDARLIRESLFEVPTAAFELECFDRLKSTGYPLGIERDTAFPAGAPTQLEAGDLVFLLTDGIVEARVPDDVPFGLDRALEVIRSNRRQSSQKIVDAIYQAICEYCQMRQPTDDITSIIIKVLPCA